MRVAIAYFANKNPNVVQLVKGLERGLVQQSHHVDTINLQTSSHTLSMYKHIIIICNCISLFGGKLPKVFQNKLKNLAIVNGSYCSAFVDKKLGATKTLENLMRLLEKEGLIISSSQILPSDEESGFTMGKNLHIYN